LEKKWKIAFQNQPSGYAIVNCKYVVT
jgi:hypothetical protein